MSSCSLTRDDQNKLKDYARRSIVHGVTHGCALPLSTVELSPDLMADRATFVTLQINGQLRGCIGTLEARQSLVEDIVENAFAAAFRDPRFPPLARHELADLEVHISILTPAEPVEFGSQEDLIAKIRPGIDGLILQEAVRRGTFLPSVWEQLPEPRDFLMHLKLKAGLPADYWSDSIEVYRYETEMISD